MAPLGDPFEGEEFVVVYSDRGSFEISKGKQAQEMLILSFVCILVLKASSNRSSQPRTDGSYARVPCAEQTRANSQDKGGLLYPGCTPMALDPCLPDGESNLQQNGAYNTSAYRTRASCPGSEWLLSPD
ncbi:hypothetical protein BRADI_4g08822v3 [Brachypodium distachyon]|uniref:Uncharacterized protein n=1 Tax=Brachypodium distachyon TaxID=15368 RepID=A0A0Q3HF79_BRADI|nr:hypothetical protein BRADI_4g08822v3 [Brachypodium distachyon]